jgi:hypothetical protein
MNDNQNTSQTVTSFGRDINTTNCGYKDAPKSNDCHTLENSLSLLGHRIEELKKLKELAQRVVNNMNRQELTDNDQKEPVPCGQNPYPEAFAIASLDIGTEIDKIWNLLECLDNSIE